MNPDHYDFFRVEPDGAVAAAIRTWSEQRWAARQGARALADEIGAPGFYESTGPFGRLHIRGFRFEKGLPPDWRPDRDHPHIAVPDRRTKRGKALAKHLAAIAGPDARPVFEVMAADMRIVDGGRALWPWWVQLGEVLVAALPRQEPPPPPPGLTPMPASEYYRLKEAAETEAEAA